VAVYMIVIVALCLVVYFTLPETGSRAPMATVSATDSIAVIVSEQPTHLETSHPDAAVSSGRPRN
jgi:hypothetical protein